MGFKLSVNKGKAVYEILNKTYLGDLFSAGGGFIGCIVGTSPHALVKRYDNFPCFFCGLTVSFSGLSWYVFFAKLKCVCVRAAAPRVCADLRVLRTHGPEIGSHDCKQSQGQNHAGPQTALPSFPITKSNSSFTLSLSLSVSISCSLCSHTLFSSSPRCQEALTQPSFSHHFNNFSMLLNPATAHWG